MDLWLPAEEPIAVGKVSGKARDPLGRILGANGARLQARGVRRGFSAKEAQDLRVVSRRHLERISLLHLRHRYIVYNPKRHARSLGEVARFMLRQGVVRRLGVHVVRAALRAPLTDCAALLIWRKAAWVAMCAALVEWCGRLLCVCVREGRSGGERGAREGGRRGETTATCSSREVRGRTRSTTSCARATTVAVASETRAFISSVTHTACGREGDGEGNGEE